MRYCLSLRYKTAKVLNIKYKISEIGNEKDAEYKICQKIKQYI